jgi:hypothetical protein
MLGAPMAMVDRTHDFGIRTVEVTRDPVPSRGAAVAPGQRPSIPKGQAFSGEISQLVRGFLVERGVHADALGEQSECLGDDAFRSRRQPSHSRLDPGGSDPTTSIQSPIFGLLLMDHRR